MKHTLGVCTWSLKTESISTLVALITEVGVRHLQLGLDPLVSGDWPVGQLQEETKGAGLSIRSGMIGMRGEDYSSPRSIRETGGVRQTKHWKHNLEAARRSAAIAQELGLNLVSFHAGFLPHDGSDPERKLLVARIVEIADVFADHKIRLALETGQETAATLLEVLKEVDRENVGVNFDPANMLLYGMGDPVEALRDLRDSVFQVHIKDATAAPTRDEWGEEVVVGSGQVDWPAFFEVLDGAKECVDLMIEREAGEQRVADMRQACAVLQGLGVVEGPSVHDQ